MGATVGVALSQPGGFSWTATDTGGSGVRSYDVRWRKAGYGTDYGAFTYPSNLQNTTTKELYLPMNPGWEYCVSARVRDNAGNVSGWSAERCLARAVDDRSLSASSGWSRLSSPSGYYSGTYTKAVRTGLSLTRSGVTTRRIVLVATRCASCGSVSVYIGSSLVGTVSLYSSTTRRQDFVSLPLMSSMHSGTVTIRTTSAKPVEIDGIAFRRS